MDKLQYDNQIRNLPQEVRRVVKIARKNTIMAKAYVALWSKLMYEVWDQRCIAVYQEQEPKSCSSKYFVQSNSKNARTCG